MSLNNRALQPEVAPPRTSAVSQGVVAEAPVPWGVRCVRELAFHDWVVVVYLSILSVTVAMVDASPVRSRCLGHVALMLAFCVAVLALVRGGIAKGTFWSPLAYRVAVYGTVQISYFELRELLPLVNSTSLDAQLSYVDESIFHFEPSLFLDRFISPATTEWFAFFYFGYFALLAVHVLPLVFFSRRHELIAEFALGMIFVYAAAHTLYMVVPGYGPIRHLAGRYQNPLPHRTMAQRGARRGVLGGCPEGHLPFAPHRRADVPVPLFVPPPARLPFKYTWHFVAFFSANIIIATMFLRWHYLVDVLAGIALAAFGFALSIVVSPRETALREKRGLQAAWVPISWPRALSFWARHDRE